MSPRRSKNGGGTLPGRYQFPRLVEETHGPWLGVRDGPAMTEGDAQHAQMFTNGYILDTGAGGAVLPRPGFQIMNPLAQLLGTPSNRYPQGIASYNPPGGVGNATFGVPGFPMTYAFVGGRMYVIGNGAAIGVWGDCTPTNVTISAAAPYIWTVNYAGLLIVSDGINPPWTWNGTTATAIDWDLSGNPAHTVAYGPPTVYYDQLMFVCNTGTLGGAGNRSTLIWSEPNNATLGYIQTVGSFTYSDTWTLNQTGSDDIQCILGTNTALFYWRRSSTGALYGSPALAGSGNPSAFATTATHDAVSLTTGTVTPKCVAATDREIYFLDQGGKPYVIVYGGFLEPMWQDCAYTFGAASQAMFPPNVTQQLTICAPSDNGSGCYDPNTRCVYWSVSSSGTTSSNPPTIYCFDTRTKKYYGQWTHTSKAPAPIGMFQVTCVPNPAGGLGAYPAQLVMHLDLNGNYYLLQGQANALPAGLGIDKTINTASGVNSYTIELSVWASEMLQDPWAETTFDRIEWGTTAFQFCNVNLDYQIQQYATFSTAQNVAEPVTVGLQKAEITAGLNAVGRALLPRITNLSVLAPPNSGVQLNAPGIVRVKLRGYQTDMNPDVP